MKKHFTKIVCGVIGKEKKKLVVSFWINKRNSLIYMLGKYLAQLNKIHVKYIQPSKIEGN